MVNENVIVKRLVVFAFCLTAPALADEGWFAFKPAEDDFAPTAIDASRYVEAPAGKHGFLAAKGEVLVFADGTPIRFWGVHVSPWFAKAKGGKAECHRQIDYQVNWMRKLGINLVRRMPMGEIGGRRRS
jgi:hypothetical protein